MAIPAILTSPGNPRVCDHLPVLLHYCFSLQVLSTVLQMLTEEMDIPVLMMRTVLQALTLYPTLGPLVLNILQLLVEKEVCSLLI